MIRRKKVYLVFDISVVAVFIFVSGYLFFDATGKYIFQSHLKEMDITSPIITTDRNGEVIESSTENGNQDKASLKQMPKLLLYAFIATEDRRFYKHEGIDWIGITRAFGNNLANLEIVEGGSSITQQLARTLFLSNEQSFNRKIIEVFIAKALERRYTKNDILELYLNHIYFGRQQYGVKAAAKRYFGINDLNQLKLWQIASLAAIPKGPSIYNPVDNYKKNKERRSVVLKLMYEQGYISKDQMIKAKSVDFLPPPPNPKKSISKYAAYTDYVFQEAEKITGLTKKELMQSGYTIVTGLDKNYQQAAEKAFNNPANFPKDGKDQKIQGATVILENNTGEIRAIVGGREYVEGGWNRAIQNSRQPGSAFKPIIVYGPALQSGKYTPLSILQDKKTSYGDYQPSNTDGKYLGSITVSRAIQDSINSPAVWLLNEIGLDSAIQFAETLGIKLSEQDSNLALALGGTREGISPLLMAQAYSVFANKGVFNDAHAVKLIKDKTGRIIYSYHLKNKQVISRQTADDMTKMLINAVNNGTGKKARTNHWVAGKTGTTQLDISGVPKKANRDLWFVGYTEKLSAAVWMGFDKSNKDNYMTENSGVAAHMFSLILNQCE
ncbi:PBP1A family penicillin-binding protein [Paenibacillus sp. sptzw28]|nr:PBP1A family penicillin-binding protein [Paenibacillus sp. sptzw28]